MPIEPMSDHLALAPQLDTLGRLFCANWSDVDHECALTDIVRKPDVLIISTGGNDIGFGGHARMLLKPGRNGVSLGDIADAKKDSIAALDNIFSHLSIRLAAAGLTSTNTILAEYPDILSDINGGTCSDQGFDRLFQSNRSVPAIAILAGYTGIKEDRAKEVRTDLYQQLNMKLVLAAGNYKWKLVGHALDSSGNTSFTLSTLGHGYCTPARWIRSYDDAAAIQGVLPDVIVSDADVHGFTNGKTYGLVNDSTYGTDAADESAIERMISEQATIGIVARWDVAQRDLAQRCITETHNGRDFKRECVGVSTHFGGIPSGIFHPNYLGHLNLSKFLIEEMQPMIWTGAS